MSSAAGVWIRYRDAIAVAGRRNLRVGKPEICRRPGGQLIDKELAVLLNQQSPGRAMLITEAVEDLLDRRAIGGTTRS